MLSLVLKDVEAARGLLLLVIPLGLVQLAAMTAWGAIFIPVALLFAGLLAFGSIVIEEMQGTEILWNSLPVSRGQIVFARYLTVLLGILIGLGSSWAVGQVVTRLGSSVERGPAVILTLHVQAVLFSLLVLAAACFLPFYFHYGAGRGLTRFSAAAVATLLIISVLAQLSFMIRGDSNPILDPARWSEYGPELQRQLAGWIRPWVGPVVGFFFGSSILALVLSALVSRRSYEARDL